jgi:hypothetical protein
MILKKERLRTGFLRLRAEREDASWKCPRAEVRQTTLPRQALVAHVMLTNLNQYRHWSSVVLRDAANCAKYRNKRI